MEFAIEEDILEDLPWKKVNWDQKEEQKNDIFYFSLTTCVYCKKGIEWLKNQNVAFRWFYLDSLEQEKRQAIKHWVQKRYEMHSRMASPFVVFRTAEKDYFSNGYDPEYWKTKAR